MKKLKKILAVGAAVLLLAVTGCGEAFSYNDYLDRDGGYDKALFFENLGTLQAADPSVITVGDTFWLYATNASANGDCSYIRAWKSKNLSDWECVGNVFVPARDAWAVNTLWAPEVVEKAGKYYMYYSGYSIPDGRMGIGLAVSDSPDGPFCEIEGTFGGKTYSRTEMPFDFGYATIDPSPFIDDDGSVYLYFARDQVDRESAIYGCKLGDDMVTVSELTQTPLTAPSQDWENPNEITRWNEAPFMLKRDGKYYLTYSANYYQNSAYAIGVAVSDDPLSGFVKADYNPVLEADPDWTFVSGTGHNSIFPSPDGTELWIAYHSHIDVENGGSERKINFDRLAFDDEGRMIVCGPSTTPQPLPSGCGEYRNIVSLAEISSTGTEEGLSLLTDGIVNYKPDGVDVYEYASEGKTKITLTFGTARTVKAIMVYDSADFALSAEQVKVTIGACTIERLAFDPANRYTDEYGYDVKIPGSAAIAEFAEMSVTEITFEFSGKISLNEIVVLGK